MLSFQRQLIVNKLCLDSLVTDMADNIKSFAFESMRCRMITQESHRCKRVSIDEMCNNIECFRSMDNTTWGHVIMLGRYPHQISETSSRYSHYIELGGSNCEKCGNFFQLRNMPDIDAQYLHAHAHPSFRRTICHCSPLGIVPDGMSHVDDPNFEWDPEEEEMEEDWDF